MLYQPDASINAADPTSIPAVHYSRVTCSALSALGRPMPSASLMLCIRFGTAANGDGFPVMVDDAGTRRKQDSPGVSHIQFE